MTPTIRFEDTHVCVVEKPAGLLSQGDSSGEPSLVDWARTHFGRNYVGLIHRLDRNTSGLMILGKRSKSADRLTQALQSGELIRKYEAVLVGDLKSAQEWEHYLLKNEKDNKVTVLKDNRDRGAKIAKLKVKPIRTFQNIDAIFTLAEFELETGRSHQIRAQSAFSGFPILGDTKYGSEKQRKANEIFKIKRTLLHSSHLSFPHPMEKITYRFDSPFPILELPKL
jgi:23S rRNA pseudouridine1911/1915/1917 synthase